MTVPTTTGHPDALPGAVLARVAHHELAGPLRLQRELLVAARRRISAVGAACDEVDLAVECVREVLGVLDLVEALGAGHPRCVDPWAVHEVLRHVRHRAPAARVTVSRVAAGVPVDGQRLLTVVGNVLTNAERHAPAAPVRVAAVVRHGCVQVDVVQGGALPAPVTDALRRHDPPPGRRGLGLWLVRRLTEQMGGRVLAVQRPAGTWVLRVVVPPQRLPSEQEDGQARDRDDARGTRPRQRGGGGGGVQPEVGQPQRGGGRHGSLLCAGRGNSGV